MTRSRHVEAAVHPFGTGPVLPVVPRTTLDELGLAATRDALPALAATARSGSDAAEIVDEGRLRGPAALGDLRLLLEELRRLPRGDERVYEMASLLRALGDPARLATWLELLIAGLGSTDPAAQDIAGFSRAGQRHCLYGWSGQTILLASDGEPVAASSPPDPDLSRVLGYSPATWGLSLHIWQPNPRALAFESGMEPEPTVILEPPHSHPFDFASTVVVGGMRQSIYEHCTEADINVGAGRYSGVALDLVDGVWPPHEHRLPAAIRTQEASVELASGDTYFLPVDRIHDVELDRRAARTHPTITLFLSSEAMVKPHVYLAETLADYHERHPDLHEQGRALTPVKWAQKLQATADYLRDPTRGLRLDDIVDCGAEYAFFHQ